MRLAGAAGLVALGLAAAACGGGGGSPAPPTVAPAKQYTLDWQGPGGRAPGKATLRLAVRTPDGKVLTRFRTGAGPHTGVHVIIVRDDLSLDHPQASAGPRERPACAARRRCRAPAATTCWSTSIPPRTPGRATSSSRTTCRSARVTPKAPLPAYAPVVKTGGLTFRVRKLPALRLAEPASMIVDVTDAQGKPVKFTPFYGALAHAIFFRAGSLDYFHSHICGSDPACAAGFGTPATTGHSTKPGRLELGILLPATGRWRLFLQVTHRGKLLTAPFTLRVR